LRYDHFDESDTRIAVQDALNRLPVRYRVPLLLYCVYGLSTAEIAQVLGVTQSGAKMRLARARQMFAELHGKGK